MAKSKAALVPLALLAVVAVAATGALANATDSSSASYSVPIADYMIDFAAASYCPSSKITAWDCVTCKLHPKVTDIRVMYSSKTDTQAFTAYDPAKNVIWLAFRGTDPLNIVNWIDDLDFIKVSYPACDGCKVHEGFYDSFLDVANATRRSVEELIAAYPSAELYVTGHSLGAALAELAALDMANQVKMPAAVYTFGCPRVGNDDWYKYYDSRIPQQHYRVTHNADPVPHLPPEVFGFHHTATEVWYNELETHYTVCNGSGEDPKCADSVLLPFLISDHLTYMGWNLTETFLACKL